MVTLFSTNLNTGMETSNPPSRYRSQPPSTNLRRRRPLGRPACPRRPLPGFSNWRRARGYRTPGTSVRSSRSFQGRNAGLTRSSRKKKKKRNQYRRGYVKKLRAYMSSVGGSFSCFSFPASVPVHFVGELECRCLGLGPLSGRLPTLVRAIWTRLYRFLRRHDLGWSTRARWGLRVNRWKSVVRWVRDV